MTFKRTIALLLAGFIMPASHAFAACPQALAVYTEMPAPDGQNKAPPAEINFYPDPNAVVVSNAFNMVLSKGPRLLGHAIWNVDAARPDGALMLNCPDGDVTGDELRACTHWVGVIYSLDKSGQMSLLPAANEDAADRLLFTDLSRALFFSDLNTPENILPDWDVFRLTGCQE